MSTGHGRLPQLRHRSGEQPGIVLPDLRGTTPCKTQHFAATEAAEFYLAGLLADYAKPERLDAESAGATADAAARTKPLHAAGRERFERLRSLGDGVLYTSGFFAEHLSTRGVELRYVRTLGLRAPTTARRPCSAKVRAYDAALQTCFASSPTTS